MNENIFPKIISTKYKKDYIKRQFVSWGGYKPNIDNPESFNEKIQWMKLYYHDRAMTTCADKYAVRQYVAKKIGPEYLLDLVYEKPFTRVEDINFDELPDKFVLKTTNGSGTNIICSNKSELDVDEAKAKLNQWLDRSRSLYYMSFEWAYKNIKPQIICEKFIDQMDGLKDYKLLCMNGRVEYIFVCSERDSGKLKIDWFDRDWNLLPFTRVYKNNPKTPKKPDNLSEMIKVAEKLADGFPFVRIDLYNPGGKIKFGEMTFYPGNGMEWFDPVEWDYTLGAAMTLPNKRYLPFEFNKKKLDYRAMIMRGSKRARTAMAYAIAWLKHPKASEPPERRHNRIMSEVRRTHFEEEKDFHFKRQKGDKKLLAFYLPQFHPIPTNDAHFGRGFTEWRNVAMGEPKYVGQMQPFLPGELGFYDLRVDDVMERQIEMAKSHGIYAFNFYYYWFDGEKVLDMPINKFMAHKEWNFNFCITWIDANWTKRWGDGAANQVIFEHKNNQDTPLRFIKEVESILLDDRYVTEDGKPVLMVYSIKNLDDPTRYIKAWRRYFKKQHNKDLYIIGIVESRNEDPRQYGFDIGADYITKTMDNYDLIPAGASIERLDDDFEGIVLDYREIVNRGILTRNPYEFPFIKAVAPSWDNESRRKNLPDSLSFSNATPNMYGKWLREVLKDKDSEFIIVNAWNEWAEANVLEPTAHYGFAVLNETTRALLNARRRR